MKISSDTSFLIFIPQFNFASTFVCICYSFKGDSWAVGDTIDGGTDGDTNSCGGCCWCMYWFWCGVKGGNGWCGSNREWGKSKENEMEVLDDKV